MFSNHFFELSKGQNRAYSKNLVEWLSYERGVSRITDYSYSCIDKEGKDSECPKKCKFRFSTDIEYWNWNQNKWVPYSDPQIYLELTQMSPKYRLVLPESQQKPGHYSLIGQIPNRMGTYRFKINHARPGWTLLNLYKKIMVRNNNNKEMVKNWPRDIVSALGVICVLASFALVSYIFLYNDDRAKFININ